MNLEDLLGRHVRYKGEEGHVVEGHSGEGRSGDESSVVVSIRGAHHVPRRNVTVPESEWGGGSSNSYRSFSVQKVLYS